MIKIFYNKNQETIHNVFWRGLQVAGKQGIIFLIFIIAAKILIPFEFGIYNYVLAIIFFLIMFGDFGISTATSKYVAEYNVNDKEKLKSVLFNSGIIILGLTLIISILVLLFGRFYLQEKYVYILYLLPLIFLAPMTSLYDGIYRGLKRFKQLSIISIIVGLISLSFIYFLIKKYGLIGALISQNLFYFILLLALALGYREFNFKFNMSVAKSIGRYSLSYGIAIFGYYLFSRIDILILGYFGYIEEVAVYELVNKIFLTLIAPFTIIGQVVFPNFARDYTLKKYHKIYSKFKKYMVLSGISSIAFGVLAYFLLPLVINHFFKEYYTQLFWSILFPCILIYAIHVYVTVINSGIIVSTGYAKLMATLNIWLGIFNLILSLALLYYIGFIGVIYATLITHIFGTIILYLRYNLKIKYLLKNEKEN